MTNPNTLGSTELPDFSRPAVEQSIQTLFERLLLHMSLTGYSTTTDPDGYSALHDVLVEWKKHNRLR